MCDAAALEALKKSIVEHDPRAVYHEHVMGHRLWLFEKHMKLSNAAQRYDHLKGYVCERLELNFNNVGIIGSAKTGFSFNPKNDFSLFSDESDLDFALVSPRHFHQFWDAYLDVARTRHLPDYDWIAKSVFRRFVTISEAKPLDHPHFEAWQKLVGPFKKDIETSFGIVNAIQYRIYDSWEAVEAYHVDGIRKLRKLLVN